MITEASKLMKFVGNCVPIYFSYVLLLSINEVNYF